jgi:hypothetical protein
MVMAQELAADVKEADLNTKAVEPTDREKLSAERHT